MKHFFSNIRLEGKFVIVLMIVALFPVSIGPAVHLLLGWVDEADDLQDRTYQMIVAQKDQQLFLKEDVAILYWITAANNTEVLEGIWEKHQKTVKLFDNQMAELTRLSQLLKTNTRRDQFYRTEIVTSFNNGLLPIAQQLYDLKWKTISSEHRSDFTPSEYLFHSSNPITFSQQTHKLDSVSSVMTQLMHTWEKDYANKLQGHEIEKSNNILYLNLKLWSFIFLTVIASLLAAKYLAKIIGKPLEQTKEYLLRLSAGSIPKPLKTNGKDELIELMESAGLLALRMKSLRKLANEISRGNFTKKISVFDAKGSVGIALMEMKDNLYNIDMEQARQNQEEKKRNWFNEGMASFNELFRIHTTELHKLADQFLEQLIKYIGAMQGGVFMVNDLVVDDVFIEQMAGRAYDSSRIHRKRLEMDEGLISRCIEERELIYMSDVPENYLRITSGIGEALPRNLLIVPIKTVDEVFGAIELASFKQFEGYEVDFVERLGEVFATTISTVKANERTAELLRRTKLQAEELASQEEELRQNIEEMKATQEEASRKEQASIGFAHTVNHIMLRADFSISGELIYANSRFSDLVGYSSMDVKGRHISMFLSTDEDKKIFREKWMTLIKGGKHFERAVWANTKDGHRRLYVTLAPVFDSYGNVSSVLLLALDVHKLTN